jgi:hypothetical protein
MPQNTTTPQTEAGKERRTGLEESEDGVGGAPKWRWGEVGENGEARGVESGEAPGGRWAGPESGWAMGRSRKWAGAGEEGRGPENGWATKRRSKVVRRWDGQK